MNNTHLELLVAARGWVHSSWHGNFYPDDLPDDWRLSYYSNEFRATVVPESDWMNKHPSEIEHWVDDTPEEFLFFLEIENPLIDWQEVSQIAANMTDQLGGFLFRPAKLDADLSIINNSLTSAIKLAPVSLLLPGKLELTQAGKELLKELKIECCWTVGEGVPAWAGSQLGSELIITRVVGNKTFTAREWREIIETCVQYGASQTYAGIRRVLLMMDRDEPQIEDLRTATVIGDMLSMTVT